MKNKKPLKFVVAAVVIGLAVWGAVWYRGYARKIADKETIAELKEFYRLVGNGYPSDADKAKLPAVMEKMAQLSKKCSPAFVDTLFAKRLDGAFLLRDYKQAEAMMDEMKGRSVAWKDGAKAKIRAHAALESGDTATAIKEFGYFVDVIRKQPDDYSDCDPYTGAEWSKEMIIVFNLKRMSSLADKLGDAAQSKKYLDEAKSLAQKVREKCANDPETKKVADGILQGL